MKRRQVLCRGAYVTRTTGTLFFPMAGWQKLTPVRMDFSKVEVVEQKVASKSSKIHAFIIVF